MKSSLLLGRAGCVDIVSRDFGYARASKNTLLLGCTEHVVLYQSGAPICEHSHGDLLLGCVVRGVLGVSEVEQKGLKKWRNTGVGSKNCLIFTTGRSIQGDRAPRSRSTLPADGDVVAEYSVEMSRINVCNDFEPLQLSTLRRQKAVVDSKHLTFLWWKPLQWPD